MSSSNTNIINFFIPNDIVVEILSRVPAKSLLQQFRWACKYWFDLITRDHVFIKKHLQHHRSTATNDDDRIVNISWLLITEFTDFSPVLYTMNFGPDVVDNDHGEEGAVLVNLNTYNLPLSNNINEYYFEFFGSCNGLILLVCYSGVRKDGTYVLWNLCTRELKELPHEPSNTYPVNDDSYRYRVLGFGYDPTIDDYKVMRIISYSNCLNDNGIDHLNNKLCVYTLGSNSWSTKMVADPLLTAAYGKELSEVGLLVNGALHWMMKLQMGIRTIMSLDITKEELRKIEGPNFFSDTSRYSFLSVFNGCLCICQETFDNELVIWMMKDYGVKDSWTKLITINMEKVLADHFCSPIHAMEPFTQYCNHGEILMVFKTCIIVVASDSKKNEARFMYSFGDLGCGYFVAANYIESLVSLNSGKYSTPAGSRTDTVRKQDLLEYEVLDGRLVRTSRERP